MDYCYYLNIGLFCLWALHIIALLINKSAYLHESLDEVFDVWPSNAPWDNPRSGIVYNPSLFDRLKYKLHGVILIALIIGSIYLQVLWFKESFFSWLAISLFAPLLYFRVKSEPIYQALASLNIMFSSIYAVVLFLNLIDVVHENYIFIDELFFQTPFTLVLFCLFLELVIVCAIKLQIVLWQNNQET